MKLRLISPPPQLIPGRFAAAGLLATVFLLAPATTPTLASTMIPTASAACPDVEVVFARGRQESPGPGVLGNAFTSALRSKVNKNVSLYAVRYPADTEVDVGANDMSAHVQSTINGCPNTRVVLGGYSLGAAVTDVVMAAPIAAFGFTNPLPPGSDQHIAAVALFGNGTQWVGPITNFNPIYTERTIDMCHGSDPICNPADPHTWSDNWPQHSASNYIQDGQVNQAADFVAGKLA
jgi:cutinase-like protein